MFLGMNDLKLIEKSYWKSRKKNHFEFICPQCRAERRIAYQPKPGLKHVFQIGLTSVVFMLATWSIFEWKGIVSFVLFWTVFEIIYRLKVRIAMACPHCGFDPYLYLTDVPRARAEIEHFWRDKFKEKGIPFPGDPELTPEELASISLEDEFEDDESEYEQEDETESER